MRVASLRLRLLAALVDAAVGIGGLAAVVGLAIAGAVAYALARGDKDARDGDQEYEHEGDEEGEQGDGVENEQGDDEGNDQGEGEEDDKEGDGPDQPSDVHCTTREFRQSLELRAALWGASAGLAVANRNWRGPGFRVVGLRRVDARTGGIVSVRSALIGVLFDQAWKAATRPLFGSRARRQRDRVSALGPQLRAVQRKYANDPHARQRAVMEFYKANAVSPFAGCGWQLAGPIVSQLVIALGSRGGRTVRDRITGTSVVVDR